MKNNPSCLFLMMGYNNPRITEKALTRLRTFVSKKDCVLIDNGSTKSLQPVATKTNVQYFSHSKNLGFSEGYNVWLSQNIDSISQDYICLINNDLFVNTEMMLALPKHMQEWSKEMNLAAIQPVLYFDEQLTKVENAGIHYYSTAMAFQNKNPDDTDSVLLNGACLFIKTEVVKEMFEIYGFLLNPIFFFNAEDVELSLRLKSRGYILFVDTGLKAQHAQSSSIGKSSEFGYKMSVRNLLWTALITRSNFELVVTFPLIIIGQIVLLFLAIKQKMFSSILFPFTETVTSLYDIKKYRHQFQKIRNS